MITSENVYLLVLTQWNDSFSSLYLWYCQWQEHCNLPKLSREGILKFLKRMKIFFRWDFNSFLFCRGVNKAFLCIILFLELCLRKLITVIVLWEFLHCSCINYPSVLCATSDVPLIQHYQSESTLLTVGIIRSICFMWKVPWFHSNNRFTA